MAKSSNPQLGMHCMRPCGNRLVVIETAYADNNATILRIRWCSKCGHNYITEEHRVLAAPDTKLTLRETNGSPLQARERYQAKREDRASKARNRYPRTRRYASRHR